MRTVAATLIGGLVCLSVVALPRAQSPVLLPWAYAIAPPDTPPTPRPARDPGPRRLPGSDKEYTAAQLSDGFNAADWWPGDHPPMPTIVQRGRRSDVRACALCHYPNGKGKPDNAAVSGLPEAYFTQQLLDYKNGTRKSTNPNKRNAIMMADIAGALTDEEIKEAATYFTSMEFTPWIRVIETDMVPKFQLVGAVFQVTEEARTEPIGRRILEVPEDGEHFERFRDPRVGFVAYVPTGSIEKGETLAKTGGNGRSVACVTCHGADLRGLGPIPAIAGRSPSYLARQLNDLRSGARRGAWSDLMEAAVAKLTDDDILELSAYAASLAP